MDETKRRLDLRAVLGVFVVVLAAGAFWAASAFAGSGSPGGWSAAQATVPRRGRPEPRRAGRRLPGTPRRIRGELGYVTWALAGRPRRHTRARVARLLVDIALGPGSSGEPFRRSTPKSAAAFSTSNQLTQPGWNSTQAAGSSQWHVTCNRQPPSSRGDRSTAASAPK